MASVKDRIKEQVKAEIKAKVKLALASTALSAPEPTKASDAPPSLRGFAGNVGRNVVDLGRGIIGLGREAVTHPVKSARTVGGVLTELAQETPKAIGDAAKSIGTTVMHPIQRGKDLVETLQELHKMPYEEQKRQTNDMIQRLQSLPEGGKRTLGMLGAGLLGTTAQEVSHPLKYGYENPVSFGLDVAFVGKATGVTKLVGKGVKTGLAHVPGYTASATKVKNAFKVAFQPQGKLRVGGFDDVADDLMKTKGQIIKAQRDLIDDTANRFYREFDLSAAEQKEFFHTVDAMRRSQAGVKATSANPKIQKAMTWWLDDEAPKLAAAAGLGKESRITNYLHHFFPDKFKAKEIGVRTPLKFAKRGYLEKSKDVGGFVDDPVVSVGAIRSKIAVDNLRDGFLARTLEKYATNADDLGKRMTELVGPDEVARLTAAGKLNEVAMVKLGLQEFNPGKLKTLVPGAAPGLRRTYLLPKDLAREMTKFVAPEKRIIDQLFVPFDYFNAEWKPLATAVRPRYHTRNVVGNQWNSIVVGGMNPKYIPMATWNQIKFSIQHSAERGGHLGKFYKGIFGDNIPDAKMMKLAIDNDVIGRGFFGADISDLARAAENGEDILRTLNSMNQRGASTLLSKLPGVKQYMQLSQKVGTALEDNARLAMFMQGMKRFKDVDKAKVFVNTHLFDYLTGLGEADRYIKKIIPFWSWTRFNVPLQVKSLVETPGRHALIQRAAIPFAQAQDATDPLSPYFNERDKEQGLVHVGSVMKNGKQLEKYARSASVLPLHDVTKVTNFLRGETRDVGITPLARLYRTVFGDPTQVQDFYGRPLEAFPGEQRKFLGTNMRGRTREILGVIPFITELNKLLGGSYTEQEKPAWNTRIEQVLSPLGTTLIDPEKQKLWFEIEEERKFKGSYQGGWETIYRRTGKAYLKTKK